MEQLLTFFFNPFAGPAGVNMFAMAVWTFIAFCTPVYIGALMGSE